MCRISGMSRSSHQQKSGLSKMLTLMPMALQLLNQFRRQQKTTRSRYVRASKGEKVMDFLLHQAERKMNKRHRR